MSFPGKHAGTEYSFGDPKGEAREHQVTRPPSSKGAHGKYKCTMAEYANIEHGEEMGERSGKAPHIHHHK